MITLNVYLDVLPEKKESYLQFVKSLVHASKQEQGCLFYAHYASVHEENQFLIVENWADQAALNRHNRTMHLQKFVAEIPQYLATECTIKTSES
ncbi:putative quinol monooxygenase [Vagococcus entomophilus]|uniref:ABM domain-containing protein n=1 Tax=Vagococcus entomophilus TaxID=1160095 RepID=A0A430AF27_9ENTE|nr:putative quinol monooxygenase [Vagococcus entomophilus]RSU06178.1 hypothetical protein CBF30_10705 [Vagococcus entomophilus]